MFQAFDVNHTVSSEGWTVTLSGKMRTTLEKATQTFKKIELKSVIERLKKSKSAKEDLEKKRLNTAFGVGKSWREKLAILGEAIGKAGSITGTKY